MRVLILSATLSTFLISCGSNEHPLQGNYKVSCNTVINDEFIATTIRNTAEKYGETDENSYGYKQIAEDYNRNIKGLREAYLNISINNVSQQGKAVYLTADNAGRERYDEVWDIDFKIIEQTGSQYYIQEGVGDDAVKSKILRHDDGKTIELDIGRDSLFINVAVSELGEFLGLQNCLWEK